MSTTNYKVATLHRQLVENLKLRLATNYPVSNDFVDTDLNPYTVLSSDSSPAAGKKVIVVKTTPAATPVSTDIFGNAAQVYCPSIINVCTESNISSGAGADIDVIGDLALLYADAGRTGAYINTYQTANGTVPSTAAMVVGNLKSTWAPIWNTLSTT
jgi:hypothetical protein